MIRVVVADDQRAVREGLALLVSLLDGIEVVGEADNGVEALRLVRELEPDVVLMDLRMPELDGAGATKELQKSGSAARVLVLTTFADDASLFSALEAGASGYLTKDASAEELERAIRALAAGETHLDPAVQRRLVAAALETVGRPQAPPASLTAREVEILKLMAAGHSNGEIAATLVVSAATVKTHVNHIFQKTGARDRVQAVRYAYEHGLA